MFVFIHGLFSSSKKCWTSDTNIFWPELVAADNRLTPAGIFLCEYHTSILAGNYGIADCARAVMSQISRTSEDGAPPPIAYKNIVFVGHSMGGIIARYVVESNKDIFQSKVIGMVLLASPSIGSDYANATSMIGKVVGFRQGRELNKMNELLRDLDSRFKEIVSGPRRFLKLFGAEAVEHKGPYFGLRPVVSHESAGRYFGAATVIPQTNHSTIVKPTSQKHASHTFLVDFVTTNYQPSKSPNFDQSISLIDMPHTTGDILFDVYSSRVERYYVERDFDKTCEKALSFQSLWIFGVSGVGKTSVIRRMIAKHQARPIEVYLGNCDSSLSDEGILDEVCATVHLDITDNKASKLRRLVEELKTRSKSTQIVLYIDEVPVGGTQIAVATAVANLISGLLSVAKSQSHDGALRFVVSSIEKPDLSLVKNPGQFGEHLRILELKRWSTTELTNLYRMLAENLKTHPLTDEQINLLVEATEGTPRFIKNFFRYKLAHKSSSFAEILLGARN